MDTHVLGNRLAFLKTYFLPPPHLRASLSRTHVFLCTTLLFPHFSQFGSWQCLPICFQNLIFRLLDFRSAPIFSDTYLIFIDFYFSYTLLDALFCIYAKVLLICFSIFLIVFYCFSHCLCAKIVTKRIIPMPVLPIYHSVLDGLVWLISCTSRHDKDDRGKILYWVWLQAK